ncbi:pilus assembly protein, partial [Janthinobacterium sp.]|uniref:pilus assembly protein n=1 Tax=Janthinobacterium sp. TaxID=1871054 RepID=UPI00293D4361
MRTWAALAGLLLAPAPLCAGPASAAVPAADGGAFYFQCGVTAGGEGGTLLRLQFDAQADGGVRAGRPLWEAGRILDGAGGAAPRRRIYTSAGDSSAPLPFEWAGLTPGQRALLERAPAAPESAAPDGLGEARLQYVRGERGLEIGRPGGIFRRRDGLLGVSVHAAPLYVGAPSAGAQGADYGAFYARRQARPGVVYLGADDGMLHAFDAGSGAELFAYIPNALIGALNVLPCAACPRRPYVDGAAASGEALLRGQWKTVLVSGMGGGAPGAFALDVSDTEQFRSGGALWEFGERDDAGIGMVGAAPLIAKFRAGGAANAPEYRYFAVLAAGPGRAAALFLLALDKPAAQAWRLGLNYFKLAAPATQAANAFGAPTLVPGADGAVRYLYAGDAQGNLWRIDFSAAAPWPGVVGKQPLFVARDGAGARQPISQAPRVAFAPGGGYLLLFGTGEAEPEPASQVQSFYAIRDDLTAQARVDGRAALARRSLRGDDAAGPALSGKEFAYAGAGAAQGWYVDFTDVGERAVNGALLAAGRIFFNTTVSGAAPGARNYAIDSVSGLAAGADGVARSGAVTGRFSAG